METRPALVLVIGYGNTLRRDDGAGCLAAEAIEGWNRPGLRVLSVAQLTPDLAATIADADHVIFIDARAGSGSEAVQMDRLTPPNLEAPALIHYASPEYLLGLCAAVYGRLPTADLVSIPAADFGLGEALSPLAACGVQSALHQIRQRIEAWLDPEPGTPAPCPSEPDTLA